MVTGAARFAAKSSEAALSELRLLARKNFGDGTHPHATCGSR